MDTSPPPLQLTCFLMWLISPYWFNSQQHKLCLFKFFPDAVFGFWDSFLRIYQMLLYSMWNNVYSICKIIRKLHFDSTPHSTTIWLRKRLDQVQEEHFLSFLVQGADQSFLGSLAARIMRHKDSETMPGTSSSIRLHFLLRTIPSNISWKKIRILVHLKYILIRSISRGRMVQ